MRIFFLVKKIDMIYNNVIMSSKAEIYILQELK